MLALFVVSPLLFLIAAVLAVAGLWPLAIIAGLLAVLVIIWPILALFAPRPTTAAAQPLAPTPSMGDVLYVLRHPEEVVEVLHDGFHTTSVLRDGRRVTSDVRLSRGGGGG